MDVEMWAVKGETVGTINKGQEKQKGLKENLSKEMKPQVDQEPIRPIFHSQPSVCKVMKNTKPTTACQEFGEIITTSETSLLHSRLCHPNRRGLQVLNLPFSEEKCPQCLEGKAKRLPFKKNEKSTGELLYSDISGPIKTATKEGERYFQVVVDDFSHFTTVYLLKTKSEAEENLMNFIKMVKTQHGTTPYTPQQNSKAERMNLMLMNKVRTKFAETDLAHTLWGEAVRASAYELNRSPTNALQNRTPASAYMLKLPQESKLEPSAKSMIMVGYSVGGYSLSDPLKDKIVSSRDVTFNESKVGVGNDTPRYQGINIEEENEYLNGKDSTEVKTDTEENKTKEVIKHGTPQQSSDESDEEFIGFEAPDKEKNKDRTVKKPSHLQEYGLYMAYCLYVEEPQDYEDAIKLGNGWETQ
ncbi:hypothetical protein PR048_011750 [Dryococelus australis]|uniref:Integrase catalytic domain-containing protein n=1 Tax=Dryococelus australis TaxID=614101 RepID=A0ABQ9HMJ3_9NEOP|nr:hypothetical protein PR048_011750 [Dryococelus australis]